MLLAVPSTIRMAAARSLELRSGFLSSAISRTWAGVTFATLTRFGSPDPFAMPAARFRSTAAGGGLELKGNQPAPEARVTTGTTKPGRPPRRAAQALQDPLTLT